MVSIGPSGNGNNYGNWKKQPKKVEPEKLDTPKAEQTDKADRLLKRGVRIEKKQWEAFYNDDLDKARRLGKRLDHIADKYNKEVGYNALGGNWLGEWL